MSCPRAALPCPAHVLRCATPAESALRPVFNELCFNLESFNPAFAGCLLQVQRTIGVSDYVRRDMALKNLIQPLAGEYGMHNNQPQLKTHRWVVGACCPGRGRGREGRGCRGRSNNQPQAEGFDGRQRGVCRTPRNPGYLSVTISTRLHTHRLP